MCIKNILFLRLEPLILHVGCRNIEAAERLLKICRKEGFKRSGIYQTRSRIMVEIIGVDDLQNLSTKTDSLLLMKDIWISFIGHRLRKKEAISISIL